MSRNIVLKWDQLKFCNNIYLTSNNIIKDYHIDKLLNSADGNGTAF